MTGHNNTGTECKKPLVTVIITTYNHGRYLPDSIESVLEQTYLPIELVIVDDGSTDNTKEIVSEYPAVKYIYQENKGLSSARNTGVGNSRGDFVVFLDADDMLYPDAIAVNLQYFQTHPACGFISGGHDLMTEDKQIIESPEWQQIPTDDHYLALLRCDYISMHAAVMYRSVVFKDHHYDETLTSCEDYDFYLQVARSYPVWSHNIKLAAYRKHGESMSGNMLHMYRSALKVIHRHDHNTTDERIKESCRAGAEDIRRHYAASLLNNLISHKVYQKINFSDIFLIISLLSFQDILKLTSFYLTSLWNISIRKAVIVFKSIKRMIGGGSSSIIPKQGHIRMGDLNRTTPLSRKFGYDRGGPVDRYYIERFLENNADSIEGDVLEIGDNTYTIAYGGQRVSKSDVLYVDESNHTATIIGDLSKADHIPSGKFDCIILTQTLHLIYDFKSALAHCARMLKSGGILLMTVPGISQIDYDEWGDQWYWSFTGNVIHKLLGDYFEPSKIKVETFGNVLVAASFLYGLGRGELSIQDLEKNDPSYEVVIAAKAVKN